MTTYALTAATGHFGQTAVKQLVALVGAENVVALARNVDKAKGLMPAGVTVRPGDYTDQDQLTDSLQGVDRLLFISSLPGGQVSRIQQHQNLINAAKAAQVSFVAYTSFPHADQSKAPLAADHQATEQALKDSGLTYAFLRNNWYLENEANGLKKAAAGKPLVYAAGTGQVGWALEREYAEAAAKILVTDAPQAVYELSGPARTYADLAAAIDGATAQSLDVAAYKEGLEAAGLPAGAVAALSGIQQSIRDGQLTPDGDTLSAVLGRELTPLPDAIQAVLRG